MKSVCEVILYGLWPEIEVDEWREEWGDPSPCIIWDAVVVPEPLQAGALVNALGAHGMGLIKVEFDIREFLDDTFQGAYGR